MTNWYVSSVAYTAVTQWAASTTFATGAIVRQLAAVGTNLERCFRVTAGGGGKSGAAEPTWVTTNNGTTTDNVLTWTECTGQEAHQHDNGVTITWTAPAARLQCLTAATNGKNVLAASDVVYLSSDHAETQAAANSIANLPFSAISVSRAGSVPPAGGDYSVGASIATTGANSITINNLGPWYGITFSSGSGSSTANIAIGNASDGAFYFRDCSFKISNTGPSNLNLATATGVTIGVVWRNCNVTFGDAAQVLRVATNNSPSKFEWEGGVVSLTGTSPTTFMNSPYKGAIIFAEGLDLSALTGTLVSITTNVVGMASFRNCITNASATLASGSSTISTGLAEFINCDSGNTNYVSNWYMPAGHIGTSISTYRNGGASDGTTNYSRQMVSNISSDLAGALELHIYKWNDSTGVSATATVEISSSGSLNNNDIWMNLEYLGDSGDCKSLFVDDYLATPTTAAATQPSSTASWTSGAGTNQKLQVSFTAQKKGLLHATVKLAKASTTVYVDPIITLS